MKSASVHHSLDYPEMGLLIQIDLHSSFDTLQQRA